MSHIGSQASASLGLSLQLSCLVLSCFVPCRPTVLTRTWVSVRLSGTRRRTRPTSTPTSSPCPRPLACQHAAWSRSQTCGRVSV